DPLGGAPTDPSVPVFERVTGWPPHQQRHRLTTLLDDLAQIIAHRPTRPQIVMLIQLLIEPLFLFHPGQTHAQRATAGKIPCRFFERFHPAYDTTKAVPCLAFSFPLPYQRLTSSNQKTLGRAVRTGPFGLPFACLNRSIPMGALMVEL